MDANALKQALDKELRSSRAGSPLFDAEGEEASKETRAPESEPKEAEKGTRVDDLVPDFYSITLDRLSRHGSRAGSRAASPDPEFRHVKLRKTPSKENIAFEEAVRAKLTKSTTNLRKTGSFYNLEARSRQGSRAGSPVKDGAGGGGVSAMGMPPIPHLLATRPGWSKSGSRAGSRFGSRAGSRAGSPEKDEQRKSASRKTSQVSSTTTTEDIATVKLKKSKMVKADHSKFELENVDLKGFKVEKKTQETGENEDLEFESVSFGRAPIPRPPSRGEPKIKKSGSTPKLQDADEDLTAAEGRLTKGRKAKEEGDEEEKERKLRPLKKTPSIQALYQSQEIETEFKMVLPQKEEEGPAKLILQLPGME